jgi:hypothetical protein
MPSFDLRVYSGDATGGATHVMIGDDEHFQLPDGARVQIVAAAEGRLTFDMLKTDPDTGDDVVVDSWWRAFPDS